MHVKGTITRFDFDTKGKGNCYSKKLKKVKVKKLSSRRRSSRK